MKTILFIFVAGIAAIVLLIALGPMILLGISLAITYYAVRRFILSDSIGGKIGWTIVGLIALSVSLSNTAAFVGALALVVLYYTYKSWKETKRKKEEEQWIFES
ncbi:flagellar basal body rod protein [Paraliobacillus salinarum]|uniref:lmo0954 family membrane protein n=1 Tax=Paraliobacillus salinarum TaxID=1158996 RepID=UPI0015F75460|nr:flagellar basal body rod protein [Paraliobacillus salinarum]